MEEDFAKFETLYKKYVDGTITKDEIITLNKMMESDLYGHKFPFFEGGKHLMKSRQADFDVSSLPEYQEILTKTMSKSRLENYRTWLRIAASVLVIAVAGLSVYLVQNRPAPDLIAELQPGPGVKILQGMRYITLPDSSTIYLNENSELRYGSDFGEDSREVYLKGEGFFDVRHQDGKPFKVHTGDVTTTVLGTAFNITTTPDQARVLVTVVRGKVEVRKSSGEPELLFPDQQALLDQRHKSIQIDSVRAEYVIMWKDQMLLFDDLALGEAIKKIEARYNVEVQLENPAMANCKVTGVFKKSDSLEHVLEMICSLHYFKYRQVQGIIVLTGKGC